MKPYYGPEDGITIYHGDCTECMPQIPNCCEAIVTDPPYFLPARHYATRRDWPRSLCDVSILEGFFREWFKNALTALRSDGFLYLFCDGQSYPVFYSLAYPHFRRVAPLVWDKLVSFNGYGWRHQHELILLGECDDAPAVKTGDGDIIRCRAVAIDDRDHPAQKPVELLRRLIVKATQSHGAVLDPFMGSGATLLAAAQIGREAIGIERDERYCEMAAQRLHQTNKLRDISQTVLPLELGA